MNRPSALVDVTKEEIDFYENIEARKGRATDIVDRIAERFNYLFASGEVFDTDTCTFVHGGGRYHPVLIAEEFLSTSGSFVHCGTIVPFSSSVGRYRFRKEQSEDPILVKHDETLRAIIGLVDGMREPTFKPISELDFADMSVAIDGQKYYLALYSDYMLSSYSAEPLRNGSVVPRRGFVQNPKRESSD